jgi:hypothetical protein
MLLLVDPKVVRLKVVNSDFSLFACSTANSLYISIASYPSLVQIGLGSLLGILIAEYTLYRGFRRGTSIILYPISY